MKNYLKLILVIFFLSSQFCFSQNPEWNIYNERDNRIIDNGTSVDAFYKDQDYLWLGSLFYLAKFDNSFKDAFIFNKHNSEINAVSFKKAIIKDRYGNIWFGTDNGLVRYDGNEWTLYNNVNSELPSNNILSLAEDIDGTLWIGMDNGRITKYNNGNWVNYDLSQLGIAYNDVNSIAIDNFGNKWVGTGIMYYSMGTTNYIGDHLLKFNDTTWTKYIHNMTNYSNGYIRFIKIDTLGNIWVSSCRSVAKFINGIWTDINITNYFQVGDPSLVPIEIDKNNDLWIGVPSKLIKLHDIDSLEILLQGINIKTIFIDSDDSKWLSTSSGLAKYKDSTLDFYQILNGMNGAKKIKLDNNGSAWLWDRTKDLTKLNRNVWRRFNPTNSGLPNSLINSVNFDLNDEMWIAAGRYLIKYENDEFLTILDIGINSWGGDHDINSIAIDQNNIKWLATTKGLGKLTESSFVFIDSSNSNIPFDILEHIALDVSGNIWVASLGRGVAKFDGINWTLFNSSNSGLLSDEIISLSADRSGKVFIGTLYGLSEYDGVNWNSYTSIIAKSIAVDSFNVKWIASDDRGLYKFDGISWTVIDTSNSEIPSNFLKHICIDKNNNKWMYCTNSDGNFGAIAVFNENGISSSVENPFLELPSEIELYQNYPNPFNSRTIIKYVIPKSGLTTLKIYDVLGNEIAVLLDEYKNWGTYEAVFNASYLPSGVYFYRIQAGDFIKTKKLILLK